MAERGQTTCPGLPSGSTQVCVTAEQAFSSTLLHADGVMVAGDAHWEGREECFFLSLDSVFHFMLLSPETDCVQK